MSMIAISGRLAADPRVHTTKNGNDMASGFMFGQLDTRTEEEISFPLGVVAFGRQAQNLLLHAKGQFLTVSGRLQGNLYEGELRFSVVADSIVSAKVVQPRGGRKPASQQDSLNKLHEA